MPIFICEAEESTVKSESITTSVSKILECVGAVTKRNWSGFEFFGFYRVDVLKTLTKINDKKNCYNNEGVLRDVQNIRNRNAGPTNEMKLKQAINNRNKKIDAVVDFASFRDIKSIINILIIICSCFSFCLRLQLKTV